MSCMGVLCVIDSVCAHFFVSVYSFLDPVPGGPQSLRTVGWKPLGKENHAGRGQAHIKSLLFTSPVAVGEPLHSQEPQFPYLYNEAGTHALSPARGPTRNGEGIEVQKEPSPHGHQGLPVPGPREGNPSPSQGDYNSESPRESGLFHALFICG